MASGISFAKILKVKSKLTGLPPRSAHDGFFASQYRWTHAVAIHHAVSVGFPPTTVISIMRDALPQEQHDEAICCKKKKIHGIFFS
jgi:hypothetical protein